MRFAGEIEYKITGNKDIEEALADFSAKLIEVIPTSGDERWRLKVYFEAQTPGEV